MPQARGHKAKYREEAFYELENKAHQRIEERQMRLKTKNVYIGSKIFECQYVSKRFEQDDGTAKIILDNFYYNFARFEKMGIVGDNGTGKSTFIKMLLNIVKPDSGQFDIGETVRFGYFSQEGLKFKEDDKVIDIITDIADYIDLGNGRKLTASQLLNYFLFSPEQQYTYVYKLSGGERRKLYLCTVLMKNPNFLVLDEPMSSMDIRTATEIKGMLLDYAEQGKSIFMTGSSLSDFSDLCTHLAFLHQGKVIRKGSVSTIFREVSEQNPIVIQVEGRRTDILSLLKEDKKVKSISLKENEIHIRFKGNAREEAELLRRIVDAGICLHSFYREAGSMENILGKEAKDERSIISYE